MIKIALSFKSQGAEKIEPFSQGTGDPINLNMKVCFPFITNIMKCVLGCKVMAKRRLKFNSDIHSI